MVLVEGTQTPFAIVHCNVFKPKPKPVTVELGLLGLVITPLPLVIDQVPIPIVGVFPDNMVDGDEIQRVWLEPAIALLGAAFTKILINAEVLGHTPTEAMLHCKTLIPKLSPETTVFGNKEFVSTPFPNVKLHEPVPVVGVLPANVVELVETQTV